MKNKVAWKVMDRKYRRLFKESEVISEELEDTIVDPNTKYAIAFPASVVIPFRFKYLFKLMDFSYRFRGHTITSRAYTLKIHSYTKAINNVNNLMITSPLTKEYDRIVGEFYSMSKMSNISNDIIYNKALSIENRLSTHYMNLLDKALNEPVGKTFSAVSTPNYNSIDTVGIPISIYRKLRIKPGSIKYFILWRNPIHTVDGIKVFKAGLSNNNTIKVPHQAWKKADGDYDGDTAAGMFLDSKYSSILEELFKAEHYTKMVYPSFTIDLKRPLSKEFNIMDSIALEKHKQKYTGAVVGLGLRLIAYARTIGMEKAIKPITEDIIGRLGQMALDAGHSETVGLGKREGRNFKTNFTIEQLDEFIQLFIDKEAVSNYDFIDYVVTDPIVKELVQKFIDSDNNSLYEIIDEEYPAYSISRGRKVPTLVLKKNSNRLFDDVILNSLERRK